MKATIWCARVRDVPPQEWEKGAEEFAQGDCRNLIIRPDASRPDVDFLGPDIDIGFRIGKFALRKRLVVSADLAYLLWKERGNMSESIENELFIVSYQHLNGVWNGRRYPIIWYEKKWADFTSSFAYDEHFDSELVKEATTLGGQQAPEDRRLGYLEKVYRDLDQAKDIEKFCDYLRSLDVHPVEEVPVLVPMARGAELHCVAVCFRSDGRVLVAKRKSDKNIMPEKWEFGCGQLHPNETFEQCLQRAYKEDFSAQLKFSDQARPVRTFLIDDKKKKRIVPGLIFVAEVTNDSAVKAHRHAKIDWIDPNHITLNAAECVPDFELSIRMAQKLRSAGNLCPTPSGALDNAVSIQDS